MSTFDLYALDPASSAWDVPAQGETHFSWEYDDDRANLLALYNKGKEKQWDGAKRIDWDLELDPARPLGLPDEVHALRGSDVWDKMTAEEQRESGNHAAAWQFSQFLHGEQGALLCSARIVESVPDMDAKYYAATQVMDEARHVEVYSRLMQEKVGTLYPINKHLKGLLDDTLSDSRWDLPYLGMQVLIEGLALAAFGVIRQITVEPLVRQLLAYVMADEARHVAFGRIALRDYYSELTSSELADREDFVIEGCHLMKERFRADEVWEKFGLPKRECAEAVDQSPYMQAFRSLLFSRIVPCVRDIGLWSQKVQDAYDQMGVLNMAGVDLEKLMRDDAAMADEMDRRRLEREHLADAAARKAEVDSVVAAEAEAERQ